MEVQEGLESIASSFKGVRSVPKSALNKVVYTGMPVRPDVAAIRDIPYPELNNDDEILFTNQSFTDMSGYSEEELLGKKANTVFFKEKGENTILQHNKKRLTGVSGSYELKIRNKNNESKYWLVSGAPSYNLLGDIVGSIGIHLDITALKNLELERIELSLMVELLFILSSILLIICAVLTFS